MEHKASDSYFWFKERLDGHRSDSIAWGLQKWTEDLLTKWTANCMEKYKIYNVVFSGGVAMNIKAMGKISNLKNLKIFLLVDQQVTNFKCKFCNMSKRGAFQR